MKLGRITKPLPPVQVRVRLAGELNVDLEAYARYYQDTQHEAVSLSALMTEMLRAFLDSDREFKEWLRTHPAAAGSHAVIAEAGGGHVNGKGALP